MRSSPRSFLAWFGLAMVCICGATIRSVETFLNYAVTIGAVGGIGLAVVYYLGRWVWETVRDIAEDREIARHLPPPARPVNTDRRGQ